MQPFGWREAETGRSPPVFLSFLTRLLANTVPVPSRCGTWWELFCMFSAELHPFNISLLTLTFCFHVCYNLKVKLSPLPPAPKKKFTFFNPGSPAGGTLLEGFVTFRSGVLLKAMAYWGWALRFSCVGSTSCSPVLHLMLLTFCLQHHGDGTPS